VGGQTYLPVEILDYVETHAPPLDSVYGISQRELAKALGYHPCSMSRPLDTLVRDGFLDAAKGPVRDGRRKQYTYRLTELGRTRLKRETKEVPLLSGEIPPPPHPFLGRKTELDQLAQFSRHGGVATFVDGPPGMGKTALVTRHLRRVKQGRIPFWFALRPASSPRQFVSALSHALSYIGAPQLAYYTQLPRAPVAREVADLTSRSLAGRTLVAVIDDVQVAGPDMRSFLSEFVRAILPRSEHQFYLVSQDAPLLESAEGFALHRLTIGGLDRVSAHDLTDREGGLADRFESIYQSSLGSPLLLKLAVQNPGVDTDAANLPAAIVRRLRIEQIRAILPAALSNEPLPSAFLAESQNLNAGQVAELLRSGILHRTLQGRVEVLQVVRAALLQRVSNADERQAHLKLAEFYARSRRPEAVRERFLHLVEGENWRLAAQLLTQQERVILRLGYSETLRNSLRHLGAVLPHSPTKVRVLMTEAVLLRAHSDYGDAITTLRRAINEADGEPKTTAECLLSIVDLYVRLQQLESAQRELTDAQRIGAVSRRLQAYFELTEGRLAEGSGDPAGAQSHYQEAFEMSRRTRNNDLLLESISAWSRVVVLQSGHEEALNLIAEALPEARQSGRPDIALNLLLARARAYSLTGRQGLAEQELREVRSEAEALGYLRQLTYTLSGLAAMALEGERWQETTMYARQATSLAERLGNELVLGHTMSIASAAEAREAFKKGGDPQLLNSAVDHGERAIEILRQLPPTDSLAVAYAYLAEAHIFRREADLAEAAMRSAYKVSAELKLGWLTETIRAEVETKLDELRGSSRQTPGAT